MTLPDCLTKPFGNQVAKTDDQGRKTVDTRAFERITPVEAHLDTGPFKIASVVNTDLPSTDKERLVSSRKTPI